jgi:hypothetical protein
MMLKLVVFIPETHLEAVKEALFAAGAGRQGNYDCCCWQVRGEGQFRPLEGSRPFTGTQGAVTRVAEYRVEMLCPAERREAVTAALRRAHPYEEPAFDFTAIIIPESCRGRRARR